MQREIVQLSHSHLTIGIIYPVHAKESIEDMQTDKSKRKGKPTASSNKWLAIGAGGIIAVVAMLIFISRPTEEATIQSEPEANIPNAQVEVEGILRETVIVPFDKRDATPTENDYSGLVRLVISGTGQAAGDDLSDAFYLFTQNGNQLDEPLTEHFDLEIDGQRAIIRLGLQDNPPPYNDDHVYVVTYDVGEQPRPIRFRISDETVDDNSGEFNIDVYWGVSG